MKHPRLEFPQRSPCVLKAEPFSLDSSFLLDEGCTGRAEEKGLFSGEQFRLHPTQGLELERLGGITALAIKNEYGISMESGVNRDSSLKTDVLNRPSPGQGALHNQAKHRTTCKRLDC